MHTVTCTCVYICTWGERGVLRLAVGERFSLEHQLSSSRILVQLESSHGQNMIQVVPFWRVNRCFSGVRETGNDAGVLLIEFFEGYIWILFQHNQWFYQKLGPNFIHVFCEKSDLTVKMAMFGGFFNSFPPKNLFFFWRHHRNTFARPSWYKSCHFFQKTTGCHAVAPKSMLSRPKMDRKYVF